MVTPFEKLVRTVYYTNPSFPTPLSKVNALRRGEISAYIFVCIGILLLILISFGIYLFIFTAWRAKADGQLVPMIVFDIAILAIIILFVHFSRLFAKYRKLCEKDIHGAIGHVIDDEF